MLQLQRWGLKLAALAAAHPVIYGSRVGRLNPYIPYIDVDAAQ